jgi:hypothetical protein
MVWALSLFRDRTIPYEEIYMACTVAYCPGIIHVRATTQRKFFDAHSDPWKLNAPRRCKWHNSGRFTRARADFPAAGAASAPGDDDRDDDTARAPLMTRRLRERAESDARLPNLHERLISPSTVPLGP